MWTEAHGARQEPGLKGRVAACAVEEIAAWLGRADPPRGGRAAPARRVVGAIAWHLRVGGPWGALPGRWAARPAGPRAGGRPLARPAGRLAAVADRARLVPALAGAGPVRRPAAGGGAPPAAQGRAAAGADAGHRRHPGGEVHRRARPARGSLPSGQP